MKKLFGGAGAGTQGMERKGTDGTVERYDYRRGAGKAPGPELRTVCADCNNGWMRFMDEDIEHVLTPLAYAAAFELKYPEGNRALARWATKVALAVSSAETWPGLQEWRTKFFNEREPPDGAWVWVVCTQWTPLGFAYLSGALGSSAAELSGYSVTFRVLHMVLQVFIPADPEAVASPESDSGSWYLQQVWPLPKLHLHWPPPAWTWIPDDEMFAFVANRMRDPQRRPL